MNENEKNHFRCEICNGVQAKQIVVKEKMLGTNDEFIYFECLNCNSLQIIDDNIDFKNYYPIEYYSFTRNINKLPAHLSFILKLRFNLLYYFDYRFFDKIKPSYFIWMKELRKFKKSRILEVGSGNGYQLNNLYNNGFEKLFGIDPYMENDIINEKMNIRKIDLFNILNEKYDVILFNHSLEHMKDHFKVLSKAKDILTDDGIIMIRMPIVSRSYQIYKSNWVEIDAPRHLIIHSLRSAKILFDKLGFEVVKTFFDTDKFEFSASEQYCLDLPLVRSSSLNFQEIDPSFSKKINKIYKELAKLYNHFGTAGRAGYIIRIK